MQLRYKDTHSLKTDLSVVGEANNSGGKQVDVEQINWGNIHPHARLRRIDDSLQENKDIFLKQNNCKAIRLHHTYNDLVAFTA